jgi:acetoacetyl-CoA synthetase
MSAKMLWKPSELFSNDSSLSHFIDWLNNTRSKNFRSYEDLWQWSVSDIAGFWESLWDFFSILHDGQYDAAVDGQPMPYTQWFRGTRLSYAEHIFRNYQDNTPAIKYKSESHPIKEISWKRLRQETASLQHILKSHGISTGDTVAAYLPCIPEATVSLLAVNSLGAIWSSCSPDFGTKAVLDRFVQIEPKVLITCTSYQYGGKKFSKSETVKELVKAMPSIRLVIHIGAMDEPLGVTSMNWEQVTHSHDVTLQFTRVPFNHPIWILYSSGTTGLPKAITHSVGGVLLEQLKYCSFHNDFKRAENCFWYTTTGWMMWNYIHGSLLVGGTMVLYDGSPAYPSLEVLWNFASEAKIHHFGTSAGFVLANIKEGITPSAKADLSSLRSIGSTGSTLPPEGFNWIYQSVKKDVWLASMSGGTDVCSAFVGGNPMLPVYEGEIQCRTLGCSLYCFDEEGKSITDEEGEMVITQPMPSMPVFFWNDNNFTRYKESYFEMFPSIWRHGDWIRITPRNGIIIYGRSDATLNRGGIRIGTSEVYRAVDEIPEVRDSLIVCIEKGNGEFWMPLFIVMKEGHVLTDDIRKRINISIRTANSPRHVPDEILEVPDIPYTISGKKTETPVKKILMGRNPSNVINTGSLRNPASLDYFVNLRKQN